MILHTLAASDQPTWINVVNFLALVGIAAMNWFNNRIAKQERKEFKDDLQATHSDLRANTESTVKIERQVNGATTAMLLTIAQQAREIANLTKDPTKIALAEMAEQQLRENQDRQAGK